MGFCGTSTILRVNWVHKWGRHHLPSEMECVELFCRTGAGVGLWARNSPAQVLQGRGCSLDGITALLRLEKTSKIYSNTTLTLPSSPLKCVPRCHIYAFFDCVIPPFPCCAQDKKSSLFSLSVYVYAHAYSFPQKLMFSFVSLKSYSLSSSRTEAPQVARVVRAELPLCP